jgi:hypothetical protein
VLVDRVGPLRVLAPIWGAPQGGATVRVYDAPDSSGPWEQYPASAFTTDANGLTAWITVREYYWDNSVPNGILRDREHHRFCAEWNGNLGYDDETVTDNVASPIEVSISPTGSCPV